MAQIFGTDGIRGTANVAPVSPEMVMALGRAAVHILAHTGSGVKPALVVGRDTRGAASDRGSCWTSDPL